MGGNEEGRGSIRAREIVSIFFRSFLIQASWSFERMQSLGFAFAMLPALRTLYPGREEFAARLRFHAEYFNTQPYLASFILGAAVRMEEKRAREHAADDIAIMKNTLMAPLGALGDSFFWAALKPLTVLIAAAVLLAGAWWAPLLFLVLYNSVHVWLRAELLVWGYWSEGDFVSLMGRYRFTRIARLFKAVALAVLGGILGMIPLWRSEFSAPFRPAGWMAAPAGLMIALVLLVALKKGASPLKLMLGLAVLCLALAYAGVA